MKSGEASTQLQDAFGDFLGAVNDGVGLVDRHARILFQQARDLVSG